MKQSDDFYKLVSAIEAKVTESSENFITQKKGKALEAYEHIEIAINSLYNYSTCSWGCFSTDHRIEAIMGRVVNHSLAALCLTKSGYYDEALSLIRNVTEITNLITLFIYDDNDLSNWLGLEEDKAWQEYGPAKVRRKIKILGKIDPIEQKHYGTLCSIGTHLNPKTKSGDYAISQIPNVGANFQEIGLMLCLNELGLALGPILLGVAKLSKLPKNIKDIFAELAISVVKSTGTITSLNYKRIIQDMNKA